jgi:hypothetical protein
VLGGVDASSSCGHRRELTEIRARIQKHRLARHPTDSAATRRGAGSAARGKAVSACNSHQRRLVIAGTRAALGLIPANRGRGFQFPLPRHSVPSRAAAGAVPRSRGMPMLDHQHAVEIRLHGFPRAARSLLAPVRRLLAGPTSPARMPATLTVLCGGSPFLPQRNRLRASTTAIDTMQRHWRCRCRSSRSPARRR